LAGGAECVELGGAECDIGATADTLICGFLAFGASEWSRQHTTPDFQALRHGLGQIAPQSGAAEVNGRLPVVVIGQ
jgi:hypothetical protein